MKLIFATNNQHKAEEVQALLPNGIEVITLTQAGIDIDIPEPYPTLEENAATKAKTIHQLTGMNCFSEDTGLEVSALSGEPGVKSARYAGEEKSFQKNIEKLLQKLKGLPDRKAQFRTVMCLLLDNKPYFFEGVCTGEIIEEQRGVNGFGYDPVFIPEGAHVSFAEMSMEEKARFSHRAKALTGLVTFLKQLNKTQY